MQKLKKRDTSVFFASIIYFSVAFGFTLLSEALFGGTSFFAEEVFLTLPILPRLVCVALVNISYFFIPGLIGLLSALFLRRNLAYVLISFWVGWWVVALLSYVVDRNFGSLASNIMAAVTFGIYGNAPIISGSFSVSMALGTFNLPWMLLSVILGFLLGRNIVRTNIQVPSKSNEF